MELNFKFDKKMVVETANRVLDEYEYKGKTIREWADLIVNPKTNADLIRSMSDEELANLFDTWIRDCNCNDVPCRIFCQQGCFNCEKNWLDWLKQEVEKE